MTKARSIFSRFLLGSYLLLVAHSGFSHCNLSDYCESQKRESHQHQGFDHIHHEYDFHLGIFHFLEHLFEEVEHIDHLAHEHLLFSTGIQFLKDVDKHQDYSPIAFLIQDHQVHWASALNAIDLPSGLKQRSYNTENPSRGPPR